MNEKTEAAPPTGLDEALTAVGLPVPIEQPGVPAKAARRGKQLALHLEDLRDADLKGKDLTRRKGLLPEHLAGADLTGAKLPEDIAKFPALAQVAAISSEARKIFIGLLAACVYSWLVIGTTTDVTLILNTASSPLPIINTPIPIAGFYVVGATLLTAVYCYFHFYLQRLWRMLATLPAIFPDGTPLDDRTDPWLLTNLVRTDVKQLRENPPPLTRLENLLTILLAWWLVPLTLIALWARYLPAHYWLGTTWLVTLIGVTALFGRHSYRLAGATLGGEMPAAEAEGDDGRGVTRRAWHEFRQIRPDWLTVALTAVVALCSFSAFRDNPQDDYTWLAKLLNFVGVRTYADLREVNVAEWPEGWDGKDWSKVKSVDLGSRNLAFADARRAVLGKADMRGVTLTHADLRDTWLPYANLREAELQGANLGGAQLQGASLVRAQLQGADLDKAQLSEAQLDGADLSGTQLQGANLSRGWLEGANLDHADLQDANLTEARLQGASLVGAQLQGADLRGAELPGVDLMGAQLQGAELGGATLWGANFTGAQLQGASFSSPPPLEGTNLTGAQPQGASVKDVTRLEGVNLTGAQLQGADLKEVWLQGADLTDAQLQGADLTDAQLQGADITGADLQGTDLTRADLQGADLRGTAIWRAQLTDALWAWADLRRITVQPMSDSTIDALISEATKDIPTERGLEEMPNVLNARLRTEKLPARPDFPEEWRSEPNVMFDQNDPQPEPFDWGPNRWAQERDYDKDLAAYLGYLACDSAELDVQSLARRVLDEGNKGRLFTQWLAARLIGTDCPRAKRLPDDMRRQLEQLAARGGVMPAPPETSPPDYTE